MCRFERQLHLPQAADTHLTRDDLLPLNKLGKWEK
jgi:hypothetical protein